MVEEGGYKGRITMISSSAIAHRQRRGGYIKGIA